MKAMLMLAGWPLVSVLPHTTASPNPITSDRQSTPDGCRVVHTDRQWPDKSVWKAALPHVLSRGVAKDKLKHPDYRLEVKTAAEVQAAVKFATKHNIRVAVLNSGHDFLGRNDAPSGLTIYLGNLKGARILEAFNPTAEGVPSVNASSKIVKTSIPPGKQVYVTFGSGMSTQKLNNALAPSNLFALGAAHGEVTVAGGWGQAGGHCPVSATYGLGVDQFVEFKVITADGELRVANAVSNPDLFWALRGGGGSTFGIVTEATVKAYPSPPLTMSLFYVNTTDVNDRKSIYPALAYFHTTFPTITEAGISGFYFVFPNAIKVFLLSPRDKNTPAPESILDPIAKKIASFPGIRPETSMQTLHWPFPSYKAFFDSSFGHGDEKITKRSDIPDEIWGHLQDLRAHMRLTRRHGPGSGEMEVAETQALGILPLDSILLEKEQLMHPNLSKALEVSMPQGRRAQLRGNLVSGGMVHRLGSDTSVNPAWRRAYTHIIATVDDGDRAFPDLTPLKALRSDYGVYLNEASVNQTNWKHAFWGSHYDKLSEIKTKYDPTGLFWVTPGVNADQFSVQDGRVCSVSPTNRARFVSVAPASDNKNIAKGIAFNADGPGFPFWATPSGGFDLSPVSSWKGAMGGSGGSLGAAARLDGLGVPTYLRKLARFL